MAEITKSDRALPSLDFDAVRRFLPDLPPRATATLLACCCSRLLCLYDREGEPSQAPRLAVEYLSQLALGHQPESSSAAKCFELLEELLDVFGDAEDDLMVHCLGTFKYALCTVEPPAETPEPGLWGARCLSSFISTVSALHHHREGESDWEASEQQWLEQALAMVANDAVSLSELRQLEPAVPVWEVELVARGCWA